MNEVSPTSDLPDERPTDTASESASATTDAPRTATWGLLLCVLAALGYSAVNACLRQLAIDCNQVLVIFIKELVTVVVVGPWLAWHAWRGRRLLPGGAVLLALAAAGLMTQLCGNLSNLWALGVIGLAVALPVMSGTNMVATAVLGRIFLGERISRQTVFAIGLVFASIVVLFQAAPRASQAIKTEAKSVAEPSSRAAVETAPEIESTPAWRRAALAIGAACMAGIVYAILVVVIRRNVTGDTPTTAVVFIITFMGVVSLGPWLAAHQGLEILRNTPRSSLGLMLLVGTLNLLAFLAITKGLQWTPAVQANTIMTSQVVLGTVVGVALFAEPASLWLVLGVCLTIAGMILIGRQVKIEPETPETPI